MVATARGPEHALTRPASRRTRQGATTGSGDGPAIESFVRQTLGCRCPDEVFRSIELERRHVDGLPVVRLLVGSRLLVYIVGAKTLLAQRDGLAAIATEGRQDRDRGAYNRFRLAIAGASAVARADRDRCVTRFAAVTGADEKAHLHWVEVAGVPAPLRPD